MQFTDENVRLPKYTENYHFRLNGYELVDHGWETSSRCQFKCNLCLRMDMSWVTVTIFQDTNVYSKLEL